MKGYEEIGSYGQTVFARAHANHLLTLGKDARKEYELSQIKQIKANNKEGVIEVYFQNGELVKYKPNGDWY